MNIVWRALRRFWRWITGRPPLFTAIRVEDLPDKLDIKKIYIVGEGEYLWFAAMICPCGCGETLKMGLMPDQRPRWTVSEHNDGSVSLHPSVWRKVGCKSHFWIKHGEIIWHR